jgi:hypothetical protein
VKSRIAVMLILLGTFVSAVQAQSTNCCQIQVGGVSSTGVSTVLPASASGPGGTYVSSETDTYPVACINSQTAKACNLTTAPTNVVTATGTAVNQNDHFIMCEPLFTPTTTQASSSSGAAAMFKDVGTSYTGVDSSGVCIKSPNSPFATSSCVVQACSTTSSGGTGGGTGCGGTGADGEPLPECPTHGPSPIILDLSGKGFVLTDAADGVVFDISGTENPIRLGWTAPGADNGFLALPGADGLVRNGKQLFGNFTPQPASDHPNGFAALAVYDLPANGGNGDGVIDARDGIFSSLRLWIDENHDGICQPEELHTLPSLGVNSISLKYELSRKEDQYGNVFRYRGRVNPDDPDTSRVDRKAYDVFFVTLGQPTSQLMPRKPVPMQGQKCAVPAKGNQGMLSTGGL